MEAQTRPKFDKELFSHRCWAWRLFINSPSDDSGALDSENDSFGSGSLSENERIGSFLGTGFDRGGESDIA